MIVVPKIATLSKKYTLFLLSLILFSVTTFAEAPKFQQINLTAGDSIRASDPRSELDLPGPSRYKTVSLSPPVIQFLVNQVEVSYKSLQKLQKFTAPKNRYGQYVSMNLQNVSKPLCSNIGELRSQIDMIHKSFFESRDFKPETLLGKYLKTSFETINLIQNQFCFSQNEMGISALQENLEVLENSWRGSYQEIKKLL